MREPDHVVTIDHKEQPNHMHYKVGEVYNGGWLCVEKNVTLFGDEGNSEYFFEYVGDGMPLWLEGESENMVDSTAKAIE